jgi:hypothetical protein
MDFPPQTPEQRHGRESERGAHRVMDARMAGPAKRDELSGVHRVLRSMVNQHLRFVHFAAELALVTIPRKNELAEVSKLLAR